TEFFGGEVFNCDLLARRRGEATGLKERFHAGCICLADLPAKLINRATESRADDERVAILDPDAFLHRTQVLNDRLLQRVFAAALDERRRQPVGPQLAMKRALDLSQRPGLQGSLQLNLTHAVTPFGLYPVGFNRYLDQMAILRVALYFPVERARRIRQL